MFRAWGVQVWVLLANRRLGYDIGELFKYQRLSPMAAIDTVLMPRREWRPSRFYDFLEANLNRKASEWKTTD